MNNLKFNLFFLILFGWSSFCFGQSEIVVTGRVVDFTTFGPLESASVYVQNSTIGTVTNLDGRFSLVVPIALQNDTLVISSIGYKSMKTLVNQFDGSEDIFLEEDIASLDEVLVVAETRPKTGNDIVLRAIERLPDNLPEGPYLQKGFVRHKERNKRQFKWLIEGAITLYDSSYAAGSDKNLRINIDEIRKSYDLREVDSLFVYTSYLKSKGYPIDRRYQKLDRDTIETATLVNAIKWNDQRVNGLDKLLKGKLNMVRNANMEDALFGKDILERHQFRLDTVLVDDGKKVYKIEISESSEFVGLGTSHAYNEGFEAKGWLYIDWDSFAIKKIEYELVAASEIQQRRSKSLFDTLVNHRLTMTYREYDDKMYPSYIYYETPKLVNIGNRSSDRREEEDTPEAREEQFYYTVQEILFTEVINDSSTVENALHSGWSEDIFANRPYNAEFWRNYNVLLESKEEEQLIQDLTRRATLFRKED